MRWPPQVSAAPWGLQDPLPRCPRLPWRLHEPLPARGGWRWRGCARRLGVGGRSWAPGRGGRGPTGAGPHSSADSVAARVAPPAPGLHACERLEEPAPERLAGQCFPGAGLGRRSLRFRDNCRVGRLGLTCSLARPVAATSTATSTATAERGVARFVCARRVGGGPGAPGTGGGRARAGRREGRERWGRGSEDSAPPRSHPCRSALVGCVRTWGRACGKAHISLRARDPLVGAASAATVPPANVTNFPNPGQRCRGVHIFNLRAHGGQRFLIVDKY